jgi:hypothetical protein
LRGDVEAALAAGAHDMPGDVMGVCQPRVAQDNGAQRRVRLGSVGRESAAARPTPGSGWRPLRAAALAMLLMEVGDFPMMRRLLRGVRDRAEALTSMEAEPAGDGTAT